MQEALELYVSFYLFGEIPAQKVEFHVNPHNS